MNAGRPDLHAKIMGLSYRPGAVGGKSPNRTPVVQMLAGMGPIDSTTVLKHELGHMLEPYLVRNPGRVKTLIHMLGLKPANLVEKVSTDRWGFPQDAHYLDRGGIKVDPVEEYANVVARQLGTPSYTDLTETQRKARVAKGIYGYTPSYPHALVHQLVAAGFIPKKV